MIGVRIVRRPGRLIIQDYRPTWIFALCVVLFLTFLVLFLRSMLGFVTEEYGFTIVWGMAALGCLVGVFRGSIREVYYFDKTTGSYAFERQFIYKRDVLDGWLSQFRGVRIQTIKEGSGRDERTRHEVCLLHDGMLFSGSYGQVLRADKPLPNFYSIERGIGEEIAKFLEVELVESRDW